MSLKAFVFSALLASASASNVRGNPRFMQVAALDGPSTDAVTEDSHHDFHAGADGYVDVETQKDSIKAHTGDYKMAVDDSVKSIHVTKQELLELLIKMRDEMKKHFGMLEETIHKRINGIFKVACPEVTADATDGSAHADCWVAMKVECQVFDIKEFVHAHRKELVTFIREHLGGLKSDFDTYLTNSNLDCSGHTHTDGACGDDPNSKDCKCDAKLEIDGILGMHLQNGDPHVIGADDGVCSPTNAPCKKISSTCSDDHPGKTDVEVWSLKPEERCPGFMDCVANAPDCTPGQAVLDPSCGDIVNDHTCVQASPGYNKNDDTCVISHLGMQGINAYYGGAGDDKGRVGRLLDSAFDCAVLTLDESKVSCSKADRDAESHHCVDSACDCACICGGHQAAETVTACQEKNLPWVPADKFPQPAPSDTCGDSSWKQANKCPDRDMAEAAAALR